MKENIKAFVIVLSRKASRLADALLENTMPVGKRRPPKKKSKRGKK